MAQRFKIAHVAWTDSVLKRVRQFSNSLELFKEGQAHLDHEELLLKLREVDNEFQSIQRKLATYLESKRTRFARFYFLSDDELVALLATSSQAKAMSRHITKCFEGVCSVSVEVD